MSDFRQATKNLNNAAKPASDLTVLPPIGASAVAGMSVAYLAKRVFASPAQPVAPTKSTGRKLTDLVRDNPKMAGGALALGAGYGLYKYATKPQQEK